MGYHKRYEDSYLDEEDDGVEGQTDAERLVSVIGKPDRTEADMSRMEKLSHRLVMAAGMPGALGAQAVSGIAHAAQAYADAGDVAAAAALWARVADTAEQSGNRELYYRAVDELGALG